MLSLKRCKISILCPSMYFSVANSRFPNQPIRSQDSVTVYVAYHMPAEALLLEGINGLLGWGGSRGSE